MKKLGLFLASVFCVAVMSGTVCGQTTYTWNVPSGDWTSSGSWTPARTTPATNDVLVFDGATQATPNVTGIPRETIGQLLIVNNAAVTFSSGTATAGTGTVSRASGATLLGSGTLFTTELAVGDIIYGNTAQVPLDITAIASNTSLTTSQTGAVAAQPFSIAPKITISGGAGDDLSIAAGSSLVVNTSTLPPILIFVGTGATGNISGNITFQGGAQRLNAADANAITFNFGTTFTAGTGFSGNAFSPAGTANVVLFASGSIYESQAGSNPFGLTAPASKVVFQTGSSYKQSGTVTPSFSGRTYANFEFNSTAPSITVTGGSAVSIDNLTITAGTLNFNMTGTPGHSIKGHISLFNGTTLNFAPASAGTVNLNGTLNQTIGGDGTLTLNDADQTVNINNASGITLTKDVTFTLGTLSFTTGVISTGSSMVSIGSGASLTGASPARYVDGNLRKTYSGVGVKGFEVGTANGYSPASVNITAGTFPADFTVGPVQGPHPNITTPASALQRYWTLTATGVTANLTFFYLDIDVPPPPSSENSFVIFKYDGSWTQPGGTVSPGTNEASITGVTSFSDWTLAQPNAPTAADGTVSGTIVDTAGNPIAGAVIHLSGTQNRKFITDANGYYHFDNVETNGFYTVTPTRANYGFSPGARSFSQLGESTEATFTAVPTGQNRNPLDTPEYFVRQHYLDFLGREPDEAGFNFWSNQILECGADAGCIERRKVNVSAAYFLSVEFQRTGGVLDRLYKASYGRSPLYTEFMADRAAIARGVVVGRRGWEGQLAANEETFVANWVERAAFHRAFDSLSHESYVDTLVSNTGVRFTQAERDSLVSGLGGGTLSRAQVLQRIAGNEDFAKARFNEAFVMMEYFGYLRRDPDAEGYRFWLNKLSEFNGDFERAEMVKAFITSGEYRDRFAH